LNTELFIVRKIAFSRSRSFSAFIIRIAIAAVALSVAVMIIASSFINGFQKEIRNKVFAFWAHLHVRPYSLADSYESSGVYRYQDFYTKKEMLPDARHIQVTAMKGGLLKAKDDFDGIVLKGVGDDFDWETFRPYLKRGSVIGGDSIHTMKQILISKLTADRLQIDTGDKVVVNFIGQEMTARAFRVRGIYETGIEEFDKQIALVDIRVIQDVNNWGRDTVGGFDIFLKEDHLFKSRSRAYFLTVFGGFLSKERFEELNKDPIDELSAKINNDIHSQNLEVMSIKEMKPGLFDWLDLQTMNELIILALMILVAVINMITTLLILILDRTNMIGLLKALGSPNSSVSKLFLYYAFVIVGSGLVIGNVAGLGICLLQQHYHFLKLPQESYYISYAPISISWTWVMSVDIGTVVVCLLLLILPSRLVGRITPVRALRFK
jgi:lipoprotein-releasing system permease protein